MGERVKWPTWLGVLALLPILAVVLAWQIDPPLRVSEIQGVVLGSGNRIAPSVRVQYYKVHLMVKADDGRTIGVFSERHVPPAVGTRIAIQERLGLLGTRTFIEIPAR
jgi:hypothetical protein